MFYTLCIFIAIMFEFCAAEEVPLPPITVCKRNSDNYSDCLKDAIQKSWPQFVKGLPEFDLPPLEPLVYEFGSALFDRGLIHALVNVSNYNGKGLTETRFLAAKSHFADEVFRLEIDTLVPKLDGAGFYSAAGTLGGFSITGKGSFNLTMEQLETTWIIKGHVTNDIWKVEDFHAFPSIGKLKTEFDLINGNKEFNNFVVAFVNNYWPPILRAMLPTGVNVWNPWLCDLANRFFSKVSFAKVFP